jgi:hypothetical protein
MDLVKQLKKTDSPKDAIWALLEDESSPILKQDKATGYSLLHACIILTEDEILEETLTSLQRFCMRFNKPALLSQVIELPDSRQRSPLLLAIQTEHLFSFDKLLSIGANPNSSEKNYSALMLATKTNQSRFIYKLLSAGAHLNNTNSFGNALMVAIEEGCEESFHQ